jgi:hypothetical protein
MSDAYFSDREFGEKPRDVREITPDAWQGIVGAINSRVDAGAFGLDFPEGHGKFASPKQREFQDALIKRLRG